MLPTERAATVTLPVFAGAVTASAEFRALWFAEWLEAWRMIGWHAQVDLRLNQRDIRHRMPWGEWIPCERCFLRHRRNRCKSCAFDLCGACLTSACVHNGKGHTF